MTETNSARKIADALLLNVEEVELHLGSSPELPKRYGKRIRSLGGRYNECRGYDTNRYVHLPATDAGLALADELTQYRCTVVLRERGNDRLPENVLFLHDPRAKHHDRGDSLITAIRKWDARLRFIAGKVEHHLHERVLNAVCSTLRYRLAPTCMPRMLTVRLPVSVGGVAAGTVEREVHGFGPHGTGRVAVFSPFEHGRELFVPISSLSAGCSDEGVPSVSRITESTMAWVLSGRSNRREGDDLATRLVNLHMWLYMVVGWERWERRAERDEGRAQDALAAAEWVAARIEALREHRSTAA